ncbi:Glutamate decarboxylase [Purpureocillium takamizusanense]|uniref:Glutamate decarboxylase n=1 Tax=Purpureocillium takamizusanense TaxID=2060973 RepID=A0A9Q8QV35_9HYPO|nr:Glutamate decarboxylase [Purpureocillium takamizusanense]UNI25042.1 Glutamate decarboxylase [Purpureocillium takamizusanense]
MPASDHGHDAEPLHGFPNGNGHPKSNKPPLRRAEETQELLDAVRDLIIPYIKAADDAASAKATGLPESHVNGRPRNTLVEPYPPQELLRRLGFSLPSDQGLGKEGLVDVVRDVLRYSVNTWDQGFMDKLTASTNAVGVVSEMVLGVLNTNVHVYHVSPALTIIEKTTAKALASCFGFDGPHAGGVTCQGGSASNLTSLAIARSALYPDTKLHGGAAHRFAVFTSAHGHFSVEKAAVTCGMGASSVVSVPVDGLGRMMPEALRTLVLDARAGGMTPLYVNATAGTTVMGAYDPVRALRRVCDEFGMWLHVDGSWGGSVCFSRRHRHRLDGCGLADSLTVNPQKMLNVPMTCSFLLTGDLRRFHAANSLRAGYLFHDDDESEEEVWDLADLTLQCGRRADSLKLALAWVYYGPAGFERGVDHAFDMAGRLTDLVAASPDFELISMDPPSCLQVCFYYAPGGAVSEASEENSRRTRAMVEKMLLRGFMFDFAPGPRGHFFRVVVNCQTLAGTVDGLFKALGEVGEEVVA